MIFSIADHIEMIKDGRKTQTRRQSGIYNVGRTYSIQPGRTQVGIQEGRILITKKRLEQILFSITEENAKEEGEYTPKEFEKLYSKIYPKWMKRYAYTFEYIPIENLKQKRLF